MSDPAPDLQMNIGSQASPTWTAGDVADEWRFSNTGTLTSTGSASWPQETRPASGVSQIAYLYAFSADTTGNGVPGGGTPVTFSNSNYNIARWHASSGTFASAPILTAYKSTAHDSPTGGDNTILGGNSSDTSSTSYLKAAAYGLAFQSTVQTPAAAPGSSPAATSGGSSTTTSTGAWSAWEDLAGDNANHFITSGGTQQASISADTYWYFMLALFMGANETPGTYTPILSCKYTWT